MCQNKKRLVTVLTFRLTGVSHTQKLLVAASHCVGAAVQSPVQTEKSLGLRAQVSLQSLSYADNLSWFKVGNQHFLTQFNQILLLFILHVCFSCCVQSH